MRLQRMLVGTTLMAAAWPVAVAQAADYGGGTPTDSGKRSPRQLTMVGIRTAANGKARLWVKISTPCGTAGLTARVQTAADGSFSSSGTTRTRLSNGVRRRARFAIAGRVLGASASGTASVRLKFTRRGRVTDRCRSGKRTWQARAAAAEPTPAPPRAGAGYYGFTSQGAGRPFPFVLGVNAAGGRVTTASFDYRLRCKRAIFEFDNITPGGAVAADGTFHLRERFTLHWREGNERYRVAVDGRFTTSGVSGTLSVKSVLRKRGSGRVLDRCATGATTFAAGL
jgi:hypothetical protein